MIPKFDDEMRELQSKKSLFPEQAKKIIYLFCNCTGSEISGTKRKITKQAQLGYELGRLDPTQANRVYWGIREIQPNEIRALATVYKFEPELFECPFDEFVLGLGGWTIKWDQAIELAEAVGHPALVRGESELRRQKQLRLSRIQDENSDGVQAVAANTDFQWEINCNGLLRNGTRDAEIATYQTFAFEYDSSAGLIQPATLLPEHKVADAANFFKKRGDKLFWVFPDLHSKVFPRFPEADVRKIIDIILFVFKDGPIGADLKEKMLSNVPLEATDTAVRRFSSTFHAAATKNDRAAVALRSQVRIVPK